MTKNRQTYKICYLRIKDIQKNLLSLPTHEKKIRKTKPENPLRLNLFCNASLNLHTKAPRAGEIPIDLMRREV